ncbi:MAG: hypothetical protein AAF721_05400 [Myxococcota bacterium]
MTEPPPLEKREYGPDGSEADHEALRSQLYWHSPGIVMYREAPVITMHQLAVYHERLGELAAEVEEFQMLVDIRIASMPTAEQRAKLREMYGNQSNLTDAAAITGRNFVINIAAKFVLGGSGLKSFSVHRTLEQALEALRAAKS